MIKKEPIVKTQIRAIEVLERLLLTGNTKVFKVVLLVDCGIGVYV